MCVRCVHAGSFDNVLVDVVDDVLDGYSALRDASRVKFGLMVSSLAP